MAGTGGTTSCVPANAVSDLGLRVGNLDAAPFCCPRLPPLAPLREVMLALEDIDIAELKDLRCVSGVVRLEEGVTLLRGIIEGEPAVDLGARLGGSGKRIGGVRGRGGAGIIDILFILRASVGLMVRAPRPVAWPGIMDRRFPDEGVVASPWPSPAGDSVAL